MNFLSSHFYLLLSNSVFLRKFFNFCRSVNLKIAFYHYSTVSADSTKNITVMVDGKLRHGGLADRLYGILTTFAFCKKKSIPFKLYFIYPFNLTNFLIPNIYDWSVSSISHNFSDVNVLVKIGEEYTFENLKLTKQTHLYTNSHNLEQLNLIYNSNYTYASLSIVR